MDNLPIELIQLIGGYLDHRDLKSLALVSTSLASKTQRIRFQTMEIVLWKDEWTSFVDFIKNGTYLHDFVQKIRFHVQSPEKEIGHPLSVWYQWFELNFQNSNRPNGGHTGTSTQNWTEKTFACLAKARIACIKENREREKATEAAFGQKGISIMLRKLKNVASIVIAPSGRGNQALHDGGNPKRPGRYIIEQTLTAKHAMRPYPPGPEEQWVRGYSENSSRYLDEDVLGLFVSNAACVAASQLKQVEIGGISWRYLANTEAVESALPQWKDLLRNTDELSLCFTSSTYLPILSAGSDGRFPLLALETAPDQIVIQASCALQELRLGWDRSCVNLGKSRPPCDRLVATYFPRLRCLTICGFQLKGTHFKDFLQQHSKPLQELNLYDIALDGSHDRSSLSGPSPEVTVRLIAEFFLWIIKHMDLQRASFSGSLLVGVGNPTAEFPMDCPCGEFCFNPERGRVEGEDGQSYFPLGRQLGEAVASAQQQGNVSPQMQLSQTSISKRARARWIMHQLAGTAIPLSLDRGQPWIEAELDNWQFEE